MANIFLDELGDGEGSNSFEPLPHPMQTSNPFLKELAATPNVFLDELNSQGQPPPKPDMAPSTLSPDAGPGYGEIFLDSAARGAARGTEKITDFYEGMKRKLSGETFFHVPQHEEAKASPEVENLINTPIDQGWSSPKWWTAKAVNAVTESWPELAAGMLGLGVRGMPGMVVGGATGAGALSLIPAFRAAKERGATDDDAVTEAAKVAAVNGGTAALAGLAGMQGFTGVLPQMIAGKTVEVLKHPIREMFVQLGLIQPGIAAAGAIGTGLVQGRQLQDIGPLELAEATGLSVLSQTPFTGLQLAAMSGGRRLPLPKLREVGPLETPPREIPVTDVAPGQVSREGFMSEQGVEQPPFYSQVKRIVEEKGPNSASPEQWSATLRNAPGVKAEELEALGIPEWLADHNGKISKADMLAHIEENQIQLIEKELNPVQAPPLKWIQNENVNVIVTQDGNYQIQRMPDGTFILYSPRGPRVRVESEQRAREIAQSNFQSHYSAADPNNAQYEQYTLPGPREKYGELLMQLPERGRMTREEIALRQQLVKTRLGAPEEAALVDRINQLEQKRKTQQTYESSHFRDKNVLAHLRYTVRQDRDGKRTFFIEEIQSDWHQQGRKEGYKKVNNTELEDAYQRALARDNEASENLRRELERVDPREDANESFSRLDNLQRQLVFGWEDRVFHNRGDATLRNIFAQTERVYGPEARRLAEVWLQAQADRAAAHDARVEGVPDAPFKTSWDELMFKRALRYAADAGYDRIAWTTGEQQIARYGALDARQQQGMLDFYGSREKLGALDKIAQKWGKKLGMQGGETEIGGQQPPKIQGFDEFLAGKPNPRPSNRVRSIDVSPAAATRIQQGLPLFERTIGEAKVTAQQAPINEPAGLRASVRQAIKVLERVRKAMDLEKTDLREIQIINDPTMSGRGDYHPTEKIIRINLAQARSPEQIFSTLSHEFGHHLMFDVFNGQQPELKQAVFDDYHKFVERLRSNPLAAETLPFRRSGISEFHDPSSGWGTARFMDLTQTQREYWFGFNEWFADNVARWATTDKKPMSLVDKFYASLGRRIREVIQNVRKIFGGKESFEAAPAMREWLDSFMQNEIFGPEVGTHLHIQGLIKNARALETEGTEAAAYPMSGSTGGGRAIIEGAGAGNAGRAMAAHADRMNWFYKVALNLQQIAKENPHIFPLQLYRELVDLQNLDVMNSLHQADGNVLRPWKHLNEQEGIALGKVIDDYANGRFMDPKELAKHGLRRPSVDELVALMEKHGLNSEAGRKQFHSIIQDLQKDLMRYKEILLAETSRIQDPLEQAQAMERIEAQIRAMDSVPFMPFARFGEYTLTWYDANGKVKEFYRFETARARDRAAEQMKAAAGADEKVLSGFLHKDVHPLLGMPPGMLDRIADKLNLSQSMRDSIDQLKFEYAPAQSFRHHFQQKDFTPGYSQDWQRAYAQYKFHGAHYFARIKYADQMREMIAEMTNERFNGRQDHTKLDQIRNFMTEHLDTVLNPKADWATFKGIMFHFHMGFRAATAAINLTQVPLVAWPNLASHFGDVKSAAALIRASTKANTYYRRATVEHMTGDEIRVLQQAMDDGLVSPKQGYEIAGLSEGRNLFKGLGKGVEGIWQTGTEYSAKMFELSEQWGRRVTLMGAYDLAKKNLNAKFVEESVQTNQLLYLKLREKGWSNEEARAYTAAKRSVDESMFEYGYHARPKMFQGGLGAALVFKSFQQNVLFNMWNNKGSMVRQLLLLGGAAGLAGLPFSEDVMGIMKMLSKHFLSKDFDLEDEVRKQVRDLSEGRISPDLVMHGVGRYSFGIPHALAMMGRLTGLAGESDYAGPSPQPMGVSVSRSIGMGNVLPIEVGRAFSPAKDQARQELQQIQRASGAGFGLGFALYNFAMSNPFTDPDRKKWEPILPAAIRDVSQAWRFASEGQERNRQGNPIIRFDPYDTLGASEIMERALGFQPTRLVARQENIAAKAEAEAFWDIRRQLLMRQFWSATRDQNSEQRSTVLEAIRNFNRGLPPEAAAKAITQTSLRQSLERRVQERARTEAGLPTNLRNIGIYRNIDTLYPEGAPAGLRDVRRVQ